LIQRVREAASGEDDDEYGSHSDYTADDEEPRLGAIRDKYRIFGMALAGARSG
jgi:hypothetical protein